MPKPVATNLQYVGGAAAILGLVAMASDVEGLYAAVKALVCVVKSNPLASKEMERIKGYQVRNQDNNIHVAVPLTTTGWQQSSERCGTQIGAALVGQGGMKGCSGPSPLTGATLSVSL